MSTSGLTERAWLYGQETRANLPTSQRPADTIRMRPVTALTASYLHHDTTLLMSTYTADAVLDSDPPTTIDFPANNGRLQRLTHFYREHMTREDYGSYDDLEFVSFVIGRTISARNYEPCQSPLLVPGEAYLIAGDNGSRNIALLGTNDPTLCLTIPEPAPAMLVVTKLADLHALFPANELRKPLYD